MYQHDLQHVLLLEEKVLVLEENVLVLEEYYHKLTTISQINLRLIIASA